nr:prolyl oligopeptidase family serine peptidase [Jiangella gansuensis]
MTAPGLIEVEELFADPEFSGASISPDGTRLACLAPWSGRTNVWVRGVDEEHADAVCVTHDERRGIRRYFWTDDPRWLLYLQDTDGNEDWLRRGGRLLRHLQPAELHAHAAGVPASADGEQLPALLRRPPDPEHEADLLARSPITMVDRIRTPLLVVQGANDVRVVKAESDAIVETLRARGVAVEYLVADDEGHGFQNPENVMTMFRTVERHFAEHLGDLREEQR